MASQMMEEVECAICLEILQKPIRMLTCGHNLCEECLRELLACSQPKRCPTCRREIDSSISIEDFPRNRVVESMIEKMDKLTVAPPEVKPLSDDAVEHLKDLAKSYEQKEQFNEAVNTWRTIIDHSHHTNKILPKISLINCCLKVGKLDEAVVSSVELVSLLTSTADQLQPIKEECDLEICNLIENFLEFEEFNVIFQLLQCRFNLLKRLFKRKPMLNKMCHIGILMTKVAKKVIANSDETEMFEKQYQFLDNILFSMQNVNVSNLKLVKVKCEMVASFIRNYGYFCNEIQDYLKAIILCNQAIVLMRTIFGDESNNYREFAYSYHNLGFALECSDRLSEAKTAYQTSIELYGQARDFKTEDERKEKISLVTNSLQGVENKLQSLSSNT